MTLEDFVLTYKGDSDTPIITIAEYYERYIKPLSPRFKNSSLLLNNTAICCFHDDTDPSLGTIKHRTLQGVRVYHCFGCGAVGTVIRMHQRIEKEYHHRDISETESALELCKLWGIDISRYSDITDNTDKKSSYYSKMMRIKSQMGAYTIREYSDELLNARNMSLELDKKIQIINSANIKMIATKKKLYD